MKIRTVMFALPIFGLIVGGLMQPVGAQTYTYTRTFTTYDSSPTVVERTFESPAIIEDQTFPLTTIERPVVIERPVTIERPVVIDSPTVVERPMVIKEHMHHGFHLGVFPLGALDLF